MGNKEGFAITGFVLGIISFIPYVQFAAIPGIIFSALGLKSKKHGLAVAGLVLSIAAIVLGILAAVLVGVIWHSVSSVVTNSAAANLSAP